MSNSSSNFTQQFLSDLPLQTEGEFLNSKFGHKEIADALTKIVINCPTPFTIGLFGKWGSGKSSIANKLKYELELKDTPVVIFDVWKHKGDSLRRAFLKEFFNQLKKDKSKEEESFLNEDFKLDERLISGISKITKVFYNPSWTEIKNKLSNWKKLIKKLIKRKREVKFIDIIIVLLVLSIFISILFGYWQLILASVAIVSSGTFLVWLLEILGIETVAFGLDRFQDPHEFEDEFARFLSEGIKDKYKRILIIFDNLDRASSEQAVEILRTIKTFLEPKDIEINEREVVFLIPCDDKEIKEHLKGVYCQDNSLFNADEFMKKFFNAALWIPSFIPSELENFAHEMLKETNCPELNNDKIAWIVTLAYRDNPRQIKQFINTLLANYLLVRERVGKDFTENFLSKNTPQLAKYFILQQLYPDEIRVIQEERVLSENEIASVDFKILKDGDFRKFIIRTSEVVFIDNFRILFTLRRSEHEKEFPGIEDFYIYLEDEREEDAKKFLEKIKDFNNKKGAFNRVVQQRLSEIRNSVSKTKAIGTLLTTLEDLGLSLSDTGYVEVCDHLRASEIKENLYMISPLILAKQIPRKFEQCWKDLINQWVIVLTDQIEEKPKYSLTEQFEKKLVQLIVENSSWFKDKEDREKIQIVLATKYATKLWVFEVFEKFKEAQREFISSEFIKNFINSISHQDVEQKTLIGKLQTLLKLDISFFNTDTASTLLTKLTEIQNHENNESYDSEREKYKLIVIDAISLVLDECEKILGEIVDQNIWDDLITSLSAGINYISDGDSKKIFVPLLLKLEISIQEPKLSEVRNLIENFFKSTSIIGLEYVLKSVDGRSEYIENSTHSSVLESRALDEQPIFKFFYEMISKSKKSEWFIKLIDRDYNRAFAKLKEENYGVPHRKLIVKKVLEKVDSVSKHDEKESFLKVCNQMKCANDAELKNEFLQKIIEFLTANENVQLQEIGFRVLSEEDHLGKARRRQLAKSILDWLEKPEITNKYQRFAIKAVHFEIMKYKGESKGLFNKYEEGGFLQFIFDELIRKTNDLEVINFAFEFLRDLKPKYEERQVNFDDIKTKHENELDQKIKMALIRNLLSLEPKRTNQKNQDFWEWAKKQPVYCNDFNDPNEWNLNSWGKPQGIEYSRFENNMMVFQGEMPTKEGSDGSYIDLKDFLELGTRYKVSCLVKAEPETNAKFYLWCHDNLNNRFPENQRGEDKKSAHKTPPEKVEELSVEFKANYNKDIRIHLWYEPGKGKIYVKNVKIYQLD